METTIEGGPDGQAGGRRAGEGHPADRQRRARPDADCRGPDRRIPADDPPDRDGHWQAALPRRTGNGEAPADRVDPDVDRCRDRPVRARAMTYVKDPRVDDYINALPAWQQAICREVRDIVHGADPEVVETIKRTVQPYFVLDGNVA